MRLSRCLGRMASLTAAAVLAGTSLVSAADLGGGGSYKDTPVYAPAQPADIWTGFYFGGQAGLGVGDAYGEVAGFPGINAGTDISGGSYGLYGGYNWQVGNAVIGFEGDYNWADVSGDTFCGAGGFAVNCRSELSWSASAVARAGYAVGRHMFYAKGGAVWADLDTTVYQPLGAGFIAGGDTHLGWTLGMGYEFAFTRNFIMRIDYTHMDFGSERHTLGGAGGLPVNVDATFDTLKVGAAFKF